MRPQRPTTFFAYPTGFTDGICVGGSATEPPDRDGDGLRDQWEWVHFGMTEAHDADEDGDGDGLTELEELAFGLDPNLPDAAHQPAASFRDGHLILTITKPPGAEYQVESAGTPLSGERDSFSAESTTILIDDDCTLEARDNGQIGIDPKRFIRLRVTAAP